MLNLAINARDAMRGQGQLTIEASNVVLDDIYARLHPEATPGEYVMLAVTDTGSGMAPEIRAKVFEPFFTTKPEGQGTGLGLSMVYGFVRQSGGHVEIYSEQGSGTTIKLYLPRSEAAEEQEPVVPVAPVSGGDETVLVVEDDDAVREVVVETLAGLGYRVLRARDALSARAIVDSGIPIDLLFTDVMMPGPMRSTELAEHVRRMQPGIAVLFTSGYTENSIVHQGRLDVGVELLSKPYSRKALAQKLRHVLANKAQRGQPLAPPLVAPPLLPQPAGAAKPRAPRFSVLLVEDDAAIRADTGEILRRAGHAVQGVPDASAALELIERQGFDVLMTDLGLPGMSGEELAACALQRRPGLALVVASGQNHLPPGREDAVLLRKPYDSRQLLASLGEAVALRRN